MELIHTFLTKISDILWGIPLMVALIGTGLYLTAKLGFVQFRYMPKALRMIFLPPHDDKSTGDISHFQALMTALAATVGTGNIAGVGTAVAMGGPGALFWMWVTGLVGMATKYAEAVLAIRYRIVQKNGTVSGGPMYYIERGLKSKNLAFAFALFTSVAAFGTGNMIQSNSVAEAVNGAFGVSNWITGFVIALLAGVVIIGGIQSIGRVTQVLVPFMIVFYMLAGIIAVFMNIHMFPAALKVIFIHAFTGEAVFGGLVGAGIKEAMRFGLARGLLSNESGQGSSPIAAAAARTDHPVTQALVSMTQTFIDTMVVCSMTGFIIIMSQSLDGELTGAKLTAVAFNSLLGSETTGGLVTALGLAVFAYSTLLGWSYYGEIAMEYIFGLSVIKYYRIIFVIFIFLGAIIRLETVWVFSDVMNALMALPNLLALVLLAGEIRKIHIDYFKGGKKLYGE
ncbi:MAG: sodium:alanine symporter family protein [Candidatus Latescibacteria bacterium]|nr:sodium:alanine symporter family protein [Candidatus Latescibacterota bacterium]